MNNNVLLVDDDIELLSSYNVCMKKHFSITTVNNPTQAIKIIKESTAFAVILTDYYMPLMNGIDFIKEVKSVSPNSVRLMLTSSADLDVAIKAINEGHIFRFLIKPINYNLLIRNINDAIEYYKNQTIEKELIHLKSRFVSIISHEYKNPLTQILTSSYIIKESIKLGIFTKVDDQLNKIQNTVSYMTNLIDKILVNSQLDNIMSLDISNFDLSDLINSIIKDLTQISNSKNNIIFDSNLNNLFINSDKNIITLIVNNLLSNSIKYSPPNKDIIISIEIISNKLTLTIKDNGYGISEEDILHIFEPFYRGANLKHTKGSGIGLCIVKKCIDLLKANISVSSVINQGTIFIIEFYDIIV